MLRVSIVSIIGTVGAQNMVDDLIEKGAVKVEPKFGARDEWPECTSDDDCGDGRACLKARMESAGFAGIGAMKASVIGCDEPNVCSEGGGWNMMEIMKMQYFCSDAQVAAAASMNPPEEMALATSGTQFDSYAEACATASDCKSGEACLGIYEEKDAEGIINSTGSMCMSIDMTHCATTPEL